MQTEVWLWSEAFIGTVEGLMQAGADAPARLDWLKRDRLVQCLRRVEVAREQYRRGKGEPLRVLFDYWRNLAGDDIREQVRLACETYHESQRPLSH
jgi:hypothetical protein